MTLVHRQLAVVVATALVTACAALVVPASAEAGPLHRCGALSGTLSNNYFSIRARNVSCPDARAIVRKFSTGDADCSDRDRRCRPLPRPGPCTGAVH